MRYCFKNNEDISEEPQPALMRREQFNPRSKDVICANCDDGFPRSRDNLPLEFNIHDRRNGLLHFVIIHVSDIIL